MGSCPLSSKITTGVPRLDHWPALRLHAMKNNPKQRLYKDLPDILNLIKLNQINVKIKKFEKLCITYGDKKIYHMIMGGL